MIEFLEKINFRDAYDVAVITGIATREDVEKFKSHSATHVLTLNVFKGWDGNLDEVMDVFDGVNVKALALFGSAGLDVSKLINFKSIEYLRVAGLVRGELNLDAFPFLKDFGFGAELKGPNKVALEWGECSNLESVGSLCSKLPGLKTLSTFPVLKSITAVKVNWIPEDLSCLLALRSLDISYWKDIVSLRQLNVGGLLESLHLSYAPNLSDYAPVSEMLNLRSLSFEKCPPFPNVDILEKLVSLEELFLTGMKIIDGDVSGILKLPRLKRLSLMDQKHLNPSRDELMRIVEKTIYTKVLFRFIYGFMRPAARCFRRRSRPAWRDTFFVSAKKVSKESSPRTAAPQGCPASVASQFCKQTCLAPLLGGLAGDQGVFANAGGKDAICSTTLSPCHAEHRRRSWGFGEDCLSPEGEFRSRRDLREAQGNPKGVAAGSPWGWRGAWRDKLPSLPAGRNRHSKIAPAGA